MASVVSFGWWSASDVPEDLTFQLWLKITENLIKGPGVASVASFGWWSASDVPKDLAFQLWLKISEKYQKLD